ncbi:kinase-like domain-containing protein [Mycena maculata]|uniref:Kinase-like domain-containing protein n=1 Tax=Mycena maculata TaxID=230809 RepID=A0AAD7JNI6_9AGAR|nr:kinase-like domain-containing protein [Mycena maculata]
MANNIPIDPTLCTNPESPGESCGGSFDHKASPGLCAMCYIATKDAAKAETMKDWPQCTGCSAQLKLLKGPRCGACLRKDQQIGAATPPPRNPLGTQDPNADSSIKSIQELQAEARRNAMQARTLQKGGSKAPAAGSASLQAAMAKGASRQITIYLVPMASNGARTEASRILANASRAFPEDMTMIDALAYLLRHWNLDWEKECSESLTPREHISLRLLGNLGIQPHSTLGTVGQFFDAHDRIHGNHPKKILQGPTTLRLPSPAIYLEGLIVVKEFEDRTGTLAPYFVHTEKENRKRKGIWGPGLDSTKRTRSQLSTPLPTRSEFADLPGFTKVDFVFAPVSVAQDGSVKIEWPDRQAPDEITTWTCPIQDVPFDQGKTKMVYKVIFDGLPWVAKRFFDVGAGTGQVEIQENHNEVVKEATRLSKLGYFLKRFLAEAKRQGVDIEHGIQVTDFRLGIEVVEDSGPSMASGFSLEQYQAAGDPDIIVWLFEPRRSSKVKHWSGTNEYPPWHQNKIGSTLNAFAHYAYLFSQESTVLADLQTATAIDENGEGIQVLFDVMTHTLNGSSGVGDHGKTGIETFLGMHECVNRCKYLRLSRDGFESDSELPPEESDDD